MKMMLEIFILVWLQSVHNSLSTVIFETIENTVVRTETMVPSIDIKRDNPTFGDFLPHFAELLKNPLDFLISEKHVERKLKAESMQMVQSSQSVFFTYHSDPKCKNPFFDTVTPSYVSNEGKKRNLMINHCLREQTYNTKYSCKIGKNKYTLFKKVFAPSDVNCATPLSTQSAEIYKHDYVCSRDQSGATASYMQIHCGEDILLETTISFKPHILYPQVYSNSRCSSTGLKSYDLDTPPTAERHWLKVCTAKYTAPKMPDALKYDATVDYYYIITVVSPSPLKIKVTRFAHSDNLCTTKKQERIYTYPDTPAMSNTMPACIRDPVYAEFPNSYYLNAAATIPRAVGLRHPYGYLTLKFFENGDSTCSQTPNYISYRTLGVCEKVLRNLNETGESTKTFISGESVSIYTYKDRDCAGTATVSTLLLSQIGGMDFEKCVQGSDNDYNRVIGFETSLPDSSSQGTLSYFCLNDNKQCSVSDAWNTAIFKPVSSAPSNNAGSIVSPAAGFLVRSFYGSPKCAGEPAMLHVEAIGPCVQTMNNSIPTGTSFKELLNEKSIEVYTYSNMDCSGVAVQSTLSISTKLGSYALNTCYSTNILKSFSYTFSSSPPNKYGFHGWGYTSAESCLAGANATTLELRGSACIPNHSDYGDGVGWKWITYSKVDSCTADGTGSNWHNFADSTCTSRNATATFIGDTGGVASTTLTIHGVKCASSFDPSKRCHTLSDTSGSIVSTAFGTGGSILERMSLSWTGMPQDTSVTLRRYNCRYNYKNMTSSDSDTATCQLSSPVNIPPMTHITGSLYFPSNVYSTERGWPECAPGQPKDAKDNKNGWMRSTCGFSNAKVKATTLTGSRLNTVTFNGLMYSTLADVAVDGVTMLSQSDRRKFPAGWRVAPNTSEIIQNVIKAHTWSTCYVYVDIKDNKPQPPLANYGVPHRTKLQSGTDCPAPIACRSVVPEEVYYEIGGCINAQILIAQCPIGTYNSGLYHGDASKCFDCPAGKTTAAPGALTIAYCV